MHLEIVCGEAFSKCTSQVGRVSVEPEAPDRHRHVEGQQSVVRERSSVCEGWTPDARQQHCADEGQLGDPSWNSGIW